MDFVRELLTNRRGIAFLLPVAMLALKALGIEAQDAQVQDVLDQAAGLASGLLALWSLRRPS